jgi:hypothetical protein
MRDEVDGVVQAATKQLAAGVYHYATTLKSTWSPQQPGDIWTGQFRYSVNIGVGSPNTGFLPAIPNQPWPVAAAQYGMESVISGVEALEAVKPYQAVYVTDAAPHAATVEQHTRIFATAADLAERDAAGTDWSSFIAAQSIPF